MLGTINFGAFLISGIILNLTPGSDTIYILSRSISSGRKAGVLSVLGISSGVIVHTLLAAFGLSTILAKSAAAFNTIKYLGAIYLIYLGVKTLLDKGNNVLLLNAEQVSSKSIYLQGLMTNVLNPKVALFFLAFLPQFVDPHSGLGAIPFIFLGATFVITGTIWCLIIAIFSSFATNKFRENTKIATGLSKLCGVIYIALGLKLLQTRTQA